MLAHTFSPAIYASLQKAWFSADPMIVPSRPVSTPRPAMFTITRHDQAAAPALDPTSSPHLTFLAEIPIMACRSSARASHSATARDGGDIGLDACPIGADRACRRDRCESHGSWPLKAPLRPDTPAGAGQYVPWSTARAAREASGISPRHRSAARALLTNTVAACSTKPFPLQCPG